MLKHIGKHNNRKVAVIFHKVPDEDHMCLIVYSDVLPRVIHDEVMKALESPVGQQESDLGNALHRTLLNDGRNALEVIHKEGFMKKVQTSQVIMTPTPSSQIRLDELNTILSEMSKGADAIKRLAEADSSSGIQNKKRDNTPKRDVGEPAKKAAATITPTLQAGPNDVLTDEMIASQQLAQATKMRNEAASLLSEATRLEADSAALVKTAVKTTKTKTTKAAAKNDNTEKTKKTKV